MSGRRTTVYLAGPISGCNERQRSGWREEAARKLGPDFEVIDPVRTTAESDQSPAAIVERDRKAIRGCDAVLANMWKESIGTSIGVMHAWTEAKLIVVVDPNHLESRVLRYYADDVAESVGEAVKSLKQFLRAEESIRSVLKRSGKTEPFQRKKLATSIRRACWDAGLDDVLYPAPVRREAIAALVRHGADLGGAVTTTTIEDTVLAVLKTLEKRDPTYAKVRETWQGYLSGRRSNSVPPQMRGVDARPAPRVYPAPQRITVASSKSHRTIWGPKISRLAQIPRPARALFERIARVEFVRMVRLTRFHGAASGSAPRMKFMSSDTADVIEGHCEDPTADLPMIQSFQVLVSRVEERAAVQAVLESLIPARSAGDAPAGPK